MPLVDSFAYTLYNLWAMAPRRSSGKIKTSIVQTTTDEGQVDIAVGDESPLHAISGSPPPRTAQGRASYSTVVKSTPSSEREHRPILEDSRLTTRRAEDLENSWKKKEQEAKAARQLYFREIEGRRDELKTSREQVDGLTKRVAQLEDEARTARVQVLQLQSTKQKLQDEKRSVLALLNTKSAELREAQTFLTKVDAVSDSEVLQLVERLNATIFQTCASVADAFEYSKYDDASGREASQRAFQKLLAWGLLAPDVMNALCCFDHAQDSVLVQTALQCLTVIFVRWLCNTWDFCTENNFTLEAVYAQIKGAESPSIAGRWRALGRKYSKNLLPQAEQRHELEQRKLAEWISIILLACGVLTEESEPLQDVLLRRFDGAFRDIVHLALEFQRIVGEQVISRDFYVFAPSTGTPFDATRMVDEWDDPKKRPVSAKHTAYTVMCATQLGLHVVTGAGEAEAMILLKPHVVLHTALQELWAEQVSPGASVDEMNVDSEKAVPKEWNAQPARRAAPSNAFGRVSHETTEHGPVREEPARVRVSHEEAEYREV
ncbi:hypothetical protein BC628DRAFT_1420092 [Trametes gibbosa]|nr:hypothetical protein BC628DRAFT_1420092 [Trametes gibbosa]